MILEFAYYKFYFSETTNTRVIYITYVLLFYPSKLKHNLLSSKDYQHFMITDSYISIDNNAVTQSDLSEYESFSNATLLRFKLLLFPCISLGTFLHYFPNSLYVPKQNV